MHTSEKRKWKYILVVNDGSYFADSLWKLITEVISHRFEHWRKGQGWRD